MQLDEIVDLSAAQEEAQRENLTLDEQSDFLNFHADRIKSAALTDFAGEDGFRAEQEVIAKVDEDLRTKQTGISAQLLSGVLDTHFGDDLEERKKFVDDLQRNGGDTSEYSPHWKGVVSDIEEELSTVSKPEIGVKAHSSMRDPKGNSLADFSITSDSKGNPKDARVFINSIQYGGLGEASGSKIENGDTIRFPKAFDPIQYLIDNPPPPEPIGNDPETGVPPSEQEISDHQEDQAEELISRNRQLEDLKKDRKSSAYAKAWDEGVTLFVDKTIREKKANNDPRYKNLGTGTWESIGSMIADAPRRTALGMAGTAMTAIELGIDARKAMGIDVPEIEEIALQEVAGDIAAADEALSKRGKFTGLGVNHPDLAEVAENVGHTIESVVKSAAFSALSPTGGLAMLAGESAGGKYNNLVQLEGQARAAGDIEKANHIREVRALSAIGNGGIEWLTERMSPVHNIVRKGMTRMTKREFGVGSLQEGGEEGVAGYANAINDLALGITNDEQFLDAISEVPEQMAYGTLGGALSSGARKIVVDYRRGQALNLLREARENQQRNGTTLKAEFEDAARRQAEEDKKRVADFKERVEYDLGDVGGFDSYMSDDEKKGDSVTEDDKLNPPFIPLPYQAKEGVFTAEDTITPKELPDDDEPKEPEDLIEEPEEEEEASTVVPLNPTVEPPAADPTPVAVSTHEADQKSESYKTAHRTAFNTIYAMFVDTLGDVAAFEAEYGTEAMNQMAIFASSQPESVIMNDDAIFHLVVDRLPTQNNANYDKFFENNFADDHNKAIFRSEKYKKLKTGAEKLAYFNEKKIREQSIPMFRELPEVFYTNKYGKFAIDTVAGIKAKIESGELDPSKHVFYDHTAGDDLLDVIEADRIIGSDAGVAGTVENREGLLRQNKLAEQEALRGSKYGIPSKSVTDILKPEEIVTANRIGTDEAADTNTHITALTDQAKDKLFARLDEMYPGGRWVGKKVGSMATKGMIHPDIPQTRTKAVIGTEQANQFIFQPFLPIAAEYRISLFVDHNGKAVPIPGGFQVKDPRESVPGQPVRWKHYGRSLMTPQQFAHVKEIVDFMNSGSMDLGTNTVYGIDAFVLDNGDVKITELNAKDHYGRPGSVSLFAAGYRGMEAIARGKHSMEALVARAALLFQNGSEGAALKMLEEAAQGGGVIPDAQLLKEKGRMFYGERVSKINRSRPLSADGIHIPKIGGRNSSIKGVTYDAEQFLKDTIAANNEFSKVAKDLLAVATKAGNPGLKAAVVWVDDRGLPEFLQKRFNDRPKVILSSDTKTFNFAIHEVGHALSRNAIPYELSVYAYENITGKQYLKRLNAYLKNGKNKDIKNIILDYIMAVEGTGLTDSIFGDRQITTGEKSSSPIYALGSLDEFIAEVYVGSKGLRQLLNSFDRDSVKESVIKRLISKVVDFLKKSLFGSTTKHSEFFDQAYQDALLIANYNFVTENEWDRDMMRAQRYSNNYELTNLRSDARDLEERDDLSKADLKYLSNVNKRIAQLAPGQAGMYLVGSRDGMVFDKTHPNYKKWRKMAAKAQGDLPPYRFDGIQKGFSDTGEIVPKFDNYTIDVEGAEYTLSLPHGSSQDDVREAVKKKWDEHLTGSPSVTEDSRADQYIKKPAAGPPLPTSITHNGYQFDKRYLNAAQRTELNNAIRNPTRLPSKEIDKILKRLSKAAGKAEFRILKRLFREPFNGYKYTNIRDAKVKLVDWLIDNPNDKGGIPASLRAKTRVQQARTLRYLMQRADDIITGKAATNEFQSLSPQIQKIVKGVIVHILSTTNAVNMTNRQMMAVNLMLKIFNDSNGEDVRGFANLAEKIDTEQKIAPVARVKRDLNARGIVHVFGDVISDWRRGHRRSSKTGTSVADKSSEYDAIFNRKGTASAWNRLISPFREGINNWKWDYDRVEKDYARRLERIGSTNSLEDARISIAKLCTQFEINPDKDPVQLLKSIIRDVERSISRKERSSNSRDNKQGAIERYAFDQIILPIQMQMQASGPIGMIEDDIIDGIEAALTPKELEILRIIREPGNTYWHQLNSIHQITRGEPVDQIQNFAHRSQYSLNPESDVVYWSRRATESADPILKPRTGLGEDESSVFNMDWRSDLAEHLKQATFELHTGVERVFTHRAINSKEFGEIMDDDDSRRERRKRLLAQVGGVTANIKNPQVQYSSLQKAVVNAMQFVNWWKLVSGKGALNQMIPMMVMFGRYPTAMVKAGLGRLPIVGSRGRSVTDAFMKRHNPDLFNRLSHFDQVIEPIKGTPGMYKRSGMPGLNVAQRAFEEVHEMASTLGNKAYRVAGFGIRLPVILTNGLTESFSAKSAFLAIYGTKLVERGIISDVSDIFTRCPYNAEAMTAAEQELDQFVLSPISPEQRGDFWQKNSFGKALIRDSIFALSRTSVQQAVRAGTSWRDFVLAAIETSRTGTQESKDFMGRALNNAIIQSMQLAAYQLVNTIHIALSVNVAQTGFFLAASVMEGDEPDKERWMRRMRILEQAELDQSKRFMLSQGIIDIALQFIPVPAVLSSNVGRGFFSDILKHVWDLDGNLDDMKEELSSIREEIGKYDNYMKHAYLLDTPSMYERATEARETLEYAAEILSRKIKNKENWIASTGADVAKNMNPFGTYIDKHSREVPEAPTWIHNFLIGEDNARAVKKDMINEGKNNAFYWWMSYLLNLAPTVRKASKSVLTEKATLDFDKMERDRKRNEKNMELLNSQ